MDGHAYPPIDAPHNRRITYAVLVGTGLLLWLMRRHAFDVPLETDECNYIYIAQRLLAGDRLYVDVWDHQPFGIFTLFAGVISIFGHTPLVFRWFAVAASLLSLILIYFIARRCGGITAGIVAAICFALTSSDPGTAGEGCNREIFMSTLILSSWWLAGSVHRHKPWPIFLAGLSLGLASCLKTVVVVHWLLLALWIAWDVARRPHTHRTSVAVIRVLLWFAAGPTLIWSASFGYFWLTDRLWAFIDAVFLFNMQYSQDSGSAFARFQQFFSPAGHPFIFDSALPLWLAAIPATLWLLWVIFSRHERHPLASLALLIIAGYIAVCLPGRAWPHYYYLMIPPLCIVVAVSLSHAIESIIRAINMSRSWKLLRIILPATLVAALLWTQYSSYISQSPFGITVTRYNSRDFWGRAIGEKIQAVTDPDDSIFVYGNEAEMYYYANRKCATRYTMITGMRVGDPTAAHRRKLLIDDLKRDPPRIIIVLFDEKPFPEWSAYLQQHYATAIGWDCHDRYSAGCDEPDPSWVTMLVYHDPTRPVEPISWQWDRKQVGGWYLGQHDTISDQSARPNRQEKLP